MPSPSPAAAHPEAAAIPIQQAPPPVIARHPPPSAAGGGMLLTTLFLLAVYFFPTIRAWMGNHPKRWSVLTLNVLGGWTIIGYIIALKWSAPVTKAGAVLLSPQAAAAAPEPGPSLIVEARERAPFPAAPAPATLAQDDIEKLSQLGALYEKGLLSAEEFQKAKAKILN